MITNFKGQHIQRCFLQLKKKIIIKIVSQDDTYRNEKKLKHVIKVTKPQIILRKGENFEERYGSWADYLKERHITCLDKESEWNLQREVQFSESFPQ